MAYGARLESVLGESPQGFESPILRAVNCRAIVVGQTLQGRFLRNESSSLGIFSPELPPVSILNPPRMTVMNREQ